MKKSLWILLLLFSFQAYSQSSERLWEEGKLTWDDFKGAPFSLSPNASELNYQLSYATTKKKVGDTTLATFETRNYINPSLSWVKEEYKTDQLLKYNQLIFDILEINRRELQNSLYRIENLFMAEEKFRTQNQAINSEIRKFQNDTKMGTDANALDYWEKRITEELNANPFVVIPEITDRDFGYGLNLGFGSGLFTGSISDHFKPSFNVVYGFDLAYGETLLFLNASLGINKVKKEYIENGLTWPVDLKTNAAILDISFGYSLVDNSKHKLTPFLGLGVFGFSVVTSEGETYDSYSLAKASLLYGLNYDFKVWKGIRLTPSPYGAKYRERAEQNVRVRLYTTSGKFENMKGSSINLSVGYSLFGRIIDVK